MSLRSRQTSDNNKQRTAAKSSLTILVKSCRQKYDGASVNSRKKNLNLFSPPFFYQNSRKNIFKFIFSNVFPKTAEKKYLNLFSPTFFQKQEKKYI